MRDDARRFESWEHSVATRLGLGAAVDYALALGVDAIAARVTALAATLREQLGRVPGLTLHDLGEVQCGIVTFTIDGVDPYELAARCAARASTSRCRPSTSRVFDFEARGLDAVARASVHYYNTDELDAFRGRAQPSLTAPFADGRRAFRRRRRTVEGGDHRGRDDRGGGPPCHGRRSRAGSAASASAIAASFECCGAHPAARSLSLAITHGWVR